MLTRAPAPRRRQRGKIARRARAREADEALRIQAAVRGRSGRKALSQRRRDVQEAQEASAAVRIQSRHRGKQRREEQRAERRAAQHIQGAQRGKLARRRAAEQALAREGYRCVFITAPHHCTSSLHLITAPHRCTSSLHLIAGAAAEGHCSPPVVDHSPRRALEQAVREEAEAAARLQDEQAELERMTAAALSVRSLASPRRTASRLVRYDVRCDATQCVWRYPDLVSGA
jgi:hypothetical protein